MTIATAAVNLHGFDFARSIGIGLALELIEEPRFDELRLASGFEAEWRRQFLAFNRIERATRLEMIAQLEAVRREVVAVIRTIPPGDWRFLYQNRILNEVGRIIDELVAGWTGTLTNASSGIYTAATTDVAKLVRAQLITDWATRIVVPTISPALLQATTDYYAAFITKVSQQIKSQITSIVSTNTLTGIPLNDTINMIGRNLTDPSIFGSIRGRAETIARTETTRLRSRGNWIGQQRVGEIIPGLMKGWSPTYINTRDAHVQAGSDYGAGNEIPVAEPFIVGGEALQYPGDPAGSARNTINCACRSYTVVPDNFIGKKAGRISVPAPEGEAE